LILTITLMVVTGVSESIEEKIRRLRELGKMAGEQKPPSQVPPPKVPPEKVSKIGALREREKKRRIIIGASVLLIIILIISFAVYTYMQSRAARELEKARQEKLAIVNQYFTGELENNTRKFELIDKIKKAQSIEELNQIDIKAEYEKALAEIEEQKRREAERKALEELNMIKMNQTLIIEQSFEHLLIQPLPEDLKKETVQTLNMLKEKINKAQTKEEVLAIDPNPYLLNLWQKYYQYLIDSLPSQKVILKRGEEKRIYTKVEAKYIISRITDYNELLQYSIEKVEMVKIALVLSRDSIVGAFISPGDKIKIYAKNGTKGEYIKIADEGFVDMILLPTTVGQISLSESQSEGTTVTSSASTTYSESQSTSYAPGQTSITSSQSSSEQYTTSQSSSESSNAFYSYNVNLAEVLKAIAANKIASPEEVKAQLEKYGWKVIDLEKDSGMLVLDPTVRFLVIVEVPAEFVTDILNYKDMLYIAKVTG